MQSKLLRHQNYATTWYNLHQSRLTLTGVKYSLLHHRGHWWWTPSSCLDSNGLMLHISVWMCVNGWTQASVVKALWVAIRLEKHYKYRPFTIQKAEWAVHQCVEYQDPSDLLIHWSHKLNSLTSQVNNLQWNKNTEPHVNHAVTCAAVRP